MQERLDSCACAHFDGDSGNTKALQAESLFSYQNPAEYLGLCMPQAILERRT